MSDYPYTHQPVVFSSNHPAIVSGSISQYHISNSVDGPCMVMFHIRDCYFFTSVGKSVEDEELKEFFLKWKSSCLE